jgi:CDP-glucose 4,6-dehydratase
MGQRECAVEDVARMSCVWQGRKILVTGATGMVGSWLTKELVEQDASVVALVRDSDPQSALYRSGTIDAVNVVSGALEDFSTVERAINEHEVDTVFHLGAQTIVGTAHRSPLATFEANIRGTYNLLEACRLHAGFVKYVVVASSDKAYGEQSRLPYTEQMSLNGRYPYEVSKTCADLVAQAYYHTYKLPIAVARCGNVYGGGDLNWSRIVPGTIRSLLKGERPVLRSDGAHVRDYIYVRDVARAYLRLAENLEDPRIQGEAFNFSTESPISVLEMVRAIKQQMSCTGCEPIIRNCAEGEIRRQHLSAAKARERLNWRPEFDLARGLSETIAWYRMFLADENRSTP